MILKIANKVNFTIKFCFLYAVCQNVYNKLSKNIFVPFLPTFTKSWSLNQPDTAQGTSQQYLQQLVMQVIISIKTSIKINDLNDWPLLKELKTVIIALQEAVCSLCLRVLQSCTRGSCYCVSAHWHYTPIQPVHVSSDNSQAAQINIQIWPGSAEEWHICGCVHTALVLAPRSPLANELRMECNKNSLSSPGLQWLGQAGRAVAHWRQTACKYSAALASHSMVPATWLGACCWENSSWESRLQLQRKRVTSSSPRHAPSI